MAFDWSGAVAYSFASAILVVALGLAVGAVGRFRGANLAFAVMECSWGLRIALSNVQSAFQAGTPDAAGAPPDWLVAAEAVQVPLGALAIGGLLSLLGSYAAAGRPGRGGPWHARRLQVVAVAASLPAVAMEALRRGRAEAGIVGEAASAAAQGAYGALQWPDALLFQMMTALQAIAALLLAIVYLRSEGEASRRREIAIFAAAMVLYPASRQGSTLLAAVEDAEAARIIRSAMVLLYVLFAATAWLVVAHRSGQRAPIAVAWAALVSVLVGLLLGAFAPGWGPSAVARLASVVLLGYGIVQHQMLGIDAKLRFTISRSSLAGLFVAVFFVASEAAQQFFGDALGSQYVGIIAAGTLVFGMAPLSRVADRIAASAIPIESREAPGPAGKEAKAAFAAAVRAALRDDGRITMREQRLLGELAEHLRLGHLDAIDIREAILAEAGVA